MCAMDYRQFVRDEASKVGLDPNLAEAMMSQESGGNPRAVSQKGAIGLLQLMPATAKELGVDPNDPLDNIRGGVRYLKNQIDKYGVAGGLAAYNAGPGRVQRTADFSGLPAETRDYVPKVMNRAAMIAEQNGAQAPQAGQTPDLDTLMKGYERAKAAGDAESASEIGALIAQKHSDALEKAKAAGDTDAVNEISASLERFKGGAAPKVSPDPQKSNAGASGPVPKAPEKAQQASQDEPSTIQKVAKTADDFVRGLADAATFGYADEIAAWLDSKVKGQDYAKALAAQRQRDKDAGAGRTVGQVAGALLPGGVAFKAAAGAGKLARVGAGVATGGIQGALYGSGSAEGDLADRLEGAAKGGMLGAAVGGAIPALLPKTAGDIATEMIKKAGSKDAAAVDAEIVKKLSEVAQNPNFRGQQVRAQQLNSVANQSLDLARSGLKKATISQGERDTLNTALKHWMAQSADDIQALRNSDIGNAVADAITRAQRVRSLTAEQEAAGGLAKIARGVVDWLPIPTRIAYPLKHILGAQQSRKEVTEKLLNPKNVKAADIVLQRVGASGPAQSEQLLQSLANQARTANAAKAAARGRPKQLEITKLVGKVSQETADNLQQARDFQVGLNEAPVDLLSLANKPAAELAPDKGIMSIINKVAQENNVLGIPDGGTAFKNSLKGLLSEGKASIKAGKEAEKAARAAEVEQLTQRFLSGEMPEQFSTRSGAFQNLLKYQKGAESDVVAYLRELAKDPSQAAVVRRVLTPGANLKKTDYYALQNKLQDKFGAAAPEVPQGILAQGSAPMVDATGAPIRSLPAYNNAAKARQQIYDQVSSALQSSELPKPAKAAAAKALQELKVGSPKNAQEVLKKVEGHLSGLSPIERAMAEDAIQGALSFYR